MGERARVSPSMILLTKRDSENERLDRSKNIFKKIVIRVRADIHSFSYCGIKKFAPITNEAVSKLHLNG